MTLSRLAVLGLALGLAAPAFAQQAVPDPYVADFITRARAALDAEPTDIPGGAVEAPDTFQPTLLGLTETEPAVALTSVDAPLSDVPVAPLAAAPPAPAPRARPAAPIVESVDTPTLQTRVVEEPSVIEDPVQIPRGAAPVRLELLQTRRRVVLLPGVGDREVRQAPTTRPASAVADSRSRVVTSRAAVLVSEQGQREVVYLSARPGPLDLGAETGCGVNALELGRRLRGTRSTSLRRGMRGDAVRAAQALLCAAGHPEAGTTGVFDAEMDAAVRAFQRSYTESGQGSLAVDGALGPKTRRALDAVVQSRFGG